MKPTLVSSITCFTLGLGLMGVSAGSGCGVAEAVRPEAPTADEAMGEKCDPNAESTNAYVLDLPPDRRSDIEVALGGKNLSVVSFNCKNIKILKTCKASGAYEYRGTSPKERVLSLESADQIRAALPLGGAGIAAAFSAEASSGSKFDLGMVIVGQQIGSASSFTAAELTGSCKGATHVITGAKMGAFAMGTSSMADLRTAAEVFGAGVSAGSKSSKLAKTRDGSVEACNAAESGADSAPKNCEAVLALELTKLQAGLGAPAEVDIFFGMTYADDGCLDSFQTCEQSCNDGEGKGCRQIGISLIEGQGVDKNIPRGIQLLHKACDLGDTRGCAAMAGMMNAEGRSKEAIDYAKKACDIGQDRDGCFELGLAHEYSQPPNMDAANKAYAKACSAGTKFACEKIGFGGSEPLPEVPVEEPTE